MPHPITSPVVLHCDISMARTDGPVRRNYAQSRAIVFAVALTAERMPVVPVVTPGGWLPACERRAGQWATSSVNKDWRTWES
jgi:hypothetical protein